MNAVRLITFEVAHMHAAGKDCGLSFGFTCSGLV